MGIKKMAMLAALGVSMASAPVLAQTSAAERSAPALVGASAQDEEGTSTTTYVIAFFVILVIGLGIYAAIDEGNPGQTSP
jgi:hypothetical protein